MLTLSIKLLALDFNYLLTKPMANTKNVIIRSREFRYIIVFSRNIIESSHLVWVQFGRIVCLSWFRGQPRKEGSGICHPCRLSKRCTAQEMLFQLPDPYVRGINLVLSCTATEWPEGRERYLGCCGKIKAFMLDFHV